MNIPVLAFRDSLLRCLPSLASRGVVVALSGGVDSMCLTYLLTQYRQQYDPLFQIHAVTLDHGYRDGSSVEAVEVGRIVKEWGVEHSVAQLSYDQPVGEITNFEEVARIRRYEIFDRICSEKKMPLVVGHNLNDQLETFIQRLQGNSSLFGLVGLKHIAKLPLPHLNVDVLRPLLDINKSDIIKTCQENGISWFEDVTNSDPHLTKRNFIRHHLVGDKDSLLATHKEVVDTTNWIKERIAQYTRNLIDANDLRFDDKTGLLELELPVTAFYSDNAIFLGRFFYGLLYPYSSVKHYHWSYAKLERQLIPKLINLLDIPSHRLTCLNLVFDVKREQNSIFISISRQPFFRNTDVSVTVTSGTEWGHWILFDQRFWLRLKQSKPAKLRIVPYNHRLHKNMNENWCKNLTSALNGIPIVISNNTLISIPTYNLDSNEIESEWCLKPNVYSVL